jgi:hypothetical protein
MSRNHLRLVEPQRPSTSSNDGDEPHELTSDTRNVGTEQLEADHIFEELQKRDRRIRALRWLTGLEY